MFIYDKHLKRSEGANMAIVKELIDRLLDEKTYKIKGGIYNLLQVDFAYNSNHIEGSSLTHEQTRYIYETKTVGIVPAKVDDVIETVNHFRMFDYILDTYKEELSEEYIKKLHYILKTSTFSSQSKEAVVGDYKKYANYVSDIETVSPTEVSFQLRTLLKEYSYKKIEFDDILDFHAKFEKIHPFYDGNGRVGRILMFKECLKNDIVPFYIDDKYKFEYYRGLNEWQKGNDKGYLRDTCLFMQDHMKELMKYFQIEADPHINTTSETPNTDPTTKDELEI